MRRAVIVDAVRSPMGKGKPHGSLAGLHAVELLSQVLVALVRRHDLDPALVDDVIIGCVNQSGEQAATPGRMAWLAAGFPESVPATTIDRRCGSSQQAVSFAAQGIVAGAYDIVIAGGIESMSRMPLNSARAGRDPFGPSVSSRYSPGLIPQGVSAELVAAQWGITRDELDEYSAESHRRAAAAERAGGFAGEIVPITVDPDGFGGVVDKDETIRPGTTRETLGALAPSFESPEMAARFPHIEWKITAGSSSQITDGASALLLMSEERAASLDVPARAVVRSSTVVGSDPLLMLTGPIAATHKLLERSGVDLADIGHVEINEAFASVPLAWQRELKADDAIINPCGGAISLGHPLGATGARVMTTMVHAMRATGVRLGLQVMCEGGGMANATLIESLEGRA